MITRLLITGLDRHRLNDKLDDGIIKMITSKEESRLDGICQLESDKSSGCSVISHTDTHKSVLRVLQYPLLIRGDAVT